jgi:methyl-accepting chemotaxis protein
MMGRQSLRRAIPDEETTTEREECSAISTVPEWMSEESKARLTYSLENIQSAIMSLQDSIANIVRETNRVNQIADQVNLLVLGGAVEAVLLREKNAIETASAADIKRFAASAMNTTYEASSSMEKVVSDLAVIWKSVKETEASLRYILSGAQKLGDSMLQMSDVR